MTEISEEPIPQMFRGKRKFRQGYLKSELGQNLKNQISDCPNSSWALCFFCVHLTEVYKNFSNIL